MEIADFTYIVGLDYNSTKAYAKEIFINCLNNDCVYEDVSDGELLQIREVKILLPENITDIPDDSSIYFTPNFAEHPNYLQILKQVMLKNLKLVLTS